MASEKSQIKKTAPKQKTALDLVKETIKLLDDQKPCRENRAALVHLNNARKRLEVKARKVKK